MFELVHSCSLVVDNVMRHDAGKSVGLGNLEIYIFRHLVVNEMYLGHEYIDCKLHSEFPLYNISQHNSHAVGSNLTTWAAPRWGHDSREPKLRKHSVTLRQKGRVLFYLQCDRLAPTADQSLHKDLHPATQTEDKVES
jgi:hypothetical protein